jgi:uncharacterized membrane protein
METLLIGAIVVLFIIVVILLFVSSAALREIESNDEIYNDLSEEFRLLTNRYNRKTYEVREIKKDIKKVENLTSMKTKEQIKFLLN